MGLKQKAIRFWNKILHYPRKYTISGGITLLFVLLYGLVFFVDKPVSFSYAGVTCTRHLTLFPKMHKAVSNDYDVELMSSMRVGTLDLASRSVCFKPKRAPVEGIEKVAVSPLGGFLLQKTFALKVAPAPIAHTAVLDKPVPLSRPLSVPLSNTDKVFTYIAKIDDKKVSCVSKHKSTECEVGKLGLIQGSPYTIELIRVFEGVHVELVAKKEITTLSATQVKTTSVAHNETLYNKPKTVDLVFDKNIAKAKATLTRIEGETKTSVSSNFIVEGPKAALVIEEDLPRSATYEITVESVEAEDGSGLEGPYTLVFNTSGGPRVTSVNIGKSGVPMGATVAVTFDQSLSEAQDVSKFITTTGGATFSSKRSNQILISLEGVPKCGDFSIKLTNDLQSNYDIGGSSAWYFASRTICHSVTTIGYSSKGRAINAYTFGTGSSTVFFTGAIHGNEVGTRTLMNNWIDDLEINARNIPEGKSIVVVPQINPDGVASGTRVNGRNVDLNRNFETADWRKDITTVNNQPFPGGGGESAMSEPETKAIANLASRLRPTVILSYHSQGSVVTANQAGASNALASTYSQLSGYRNVTGQSDTTFEYSISGTADDWYAQKIGVASVLIELGSHSSAQFSRNQKAMWAMVNNS